MSISSRITNMTTNISNAYDSLEKLGQTADNKNLENLSTLIDNIYDNAPKTSYAEGSNITIENCLKGKLDYEDDKVGYGDTEQETTTGKNLLDSSTIAQITYRGITISYDNSKQEITLNGTCNMNNTTFAFSNTSFGVTNNLTTLSIYYVSGTVDSASGTNCLNFASSSYGLYTRVTLDNLAQDKVISSTYDGNNYTAVNNFIRVDNGTKFTNLKFKVMLADSTDTTYEPYTGGIPAPNPSYKEDVQVVTGEQEVVVRGINLFNASIQEGTYGSATYSVGEKGLITQSANDGSGWSFSQDRIFELPAGTYTISVTGRTQPTNIQLRDLTHSDDLVATTDSKKTFTLTETAKIGFKTYGATNYYPQSYYIQIQTGSSDTTYEPYITPITKQLSLGDIEFARIGDYRDYIWTDRSTGKWYKHSVIGKVILNGSQGSWSTTGGSTHNSYQKTSLINAHSENDSALYFCDYYRAITVNQRYQNNTFFININSTIIITNDNIATANDFKTWIDTYKPIVYYVLATATDTEITDTSLINQLEDIYNMQSVNGTTIIEINGNLPMIMKVRALKNG